MRGGVGGAGGVFADFNRREREMLSQPDCRRICSPLEMNHNFTFCQGDAVVSVDINYEDSLPLS